MEGTSGVATIGYDAFPAQAAFHRSPAPRRAFIGGYGAGKTWAACWEAIYLSASNAGTGTVGAIISPTYRMMSDTTYRTMIEILEANHIPFEEVRSAWKIRLPWFGVEVIFRSGEDARKLKGLNLAWAILDEAALMDYSVFQVALSRVRDPNARRYGLAITTTPEGFNWVYDVFGKDDREDYEVFRAATSENVTLPEEFVASLEADYDEDQQRAYLLGEFVDLHRGQVYTGFDRDRHVEEFEFAPPGPLVQAWDFNVDPACTLVGWFDGRRFWIHDEITISGGTDTPEVAEEFVRRYGDWTGDVLVYGDAAGSSRSTKAAVSDYRLIDEVLRPAFGTRFLGADVPKANPPVVDRINAVNRELREDRVLIHPRCGRLIDDLARVGWKEGARVIDKTGDRNLTHASDALGYWIHREAPVRGPRTQDRLADALGAAGSSRFAGMKM